MNISKQTRILEKKWMTLMQPYNAKSHTDNKFCVFHVLVFLVTLRSGNKTVFFLLFPVESLYVNTVLLI